MSDYLPINGQVKYNVCSLIDRRKDELLEFLQDLVRTPSIVGDEGRAQQLVMNKFKSIDLTVDSWEPNSEELRKHPAWVETSWGYRNRPNVVGVLRGMGEGRSIILNGHIDVVSPEPVEAWKHNPWKPEIENGKLYGRGSYDMKSGIAAMTYAVQCLQESGLKLKGDVILESVVEEEAGGGGTLATLLRGYKAHAAIVTEPSGSNWICTGTAGLLWFRIRVLGKTEHAATAWRGVNAIEKAAKIYYALKNLDQFRAQKIRDPLYEKHPDFGGRATSLNVGTIRGGDWPSTVAGWAVLECRVGWPWSQNMDDVKREVEETVRKTAELDPWLKEHPPKVEWFGWKAEASRQDPDHRIVRIVKTYAQEVTRKTVEIWMDPAGDDSRFFTLYASIPAIIYGPSGGNAHGVDEYVEIDDVVATAKVLALSMLEWCGYEKKA